MSFVRGPNPIWYEFNQTGEIFNDTYYAFFLTNDLPYVPQAVYQDPDGINPWSNPIEFQASGGLPNNLYFNPNQVYRIEFRQGPLDTDPLIGNPIENYVPVSQGSSIASFSGSDNLITNPTFSDVYFSGSTTITTAGTYDIAPGWQLVLTGTGSVTVSQTAVDGVSSTTTNLPYNPGYYLSIINTGWTTIQLVQKLSNNGAIFQNGAMFIAFTAEAIGSNQNIVVQYKPSTGSNITLINANVSAGSFIEYKNGVNITTSTNTDDPPAAYVDIVFNLITNTTFYITNVQMVGQESALGNSFVSTNAPDYQEQTYERMVDHEFHVYRQSLLREQKNSILTAWNFANNPWQYYSVTHGNVATNEYTADQTIMIQQNYVASATGNNVNVTRDSESHNYGYAVTAVTAHNEFAILQYIDPQSARELWNNYVSSMVSCTLYSAHSSTVTLKMRLIYKAGLPNTVSQTDPIASWTENGDPVAAPGYTLVIPPNDPVYTLSANVSNKFVFDKILLPTSTNDNMTLGILVYTTKNMNETATADYITFNDISLVLNDFALPTQLETFDQTLLKCQYYYEKSNPVGQLAGAVNGGNYVTVYQNTFGTANLYFTTFMFYYKTVKRIVPLIYTWALDGTVNGIKMLILLNGAAATASVGSANSNPFNAANSNWTFTSFTDKCFAVSKDTNTAQITSTSTTVEGIAQFQYALDARLGI